MAEFIFILGGTIFAIYAGLRIARYVRTESKRRADARLKDHLKWSHQSKNNSWV